MKSHWPEGHSLIAAYDYWIDALWKDVSINNGTEGYQEWQLIKLHNTELYLTPFEQVIEHIKHFLNRIAKMINHTVY